MTDRNIFAFATDEERWCAVRQRDAGADGKFLFSVRTTGIYCRPNCSARTPRRENVDFHTDGAAARAAGFRACLRCRPDGPSRSATQAAAIEAACRLIDQAETPPSLTELACVAGFSPHYFHRVFREVTGLTPRDYAAARRAEAARRELQEAGSVTEAIYGAGFNASSRFYASAPHMLGMKPAAYRAGGAGERIRFAVGQCSLGAVLVAATEKGVCAILMGNDADALVRDLQDRFPRAELVGDDASFETTVATVIGMIERPGATTDLPLDVRGTAFQERVWRVLRQVPAGETISYAELARRVGDPSAARAVAQACGANAIAVAIPCHRVVRTDGSISGYRWGVERKHALLHRETIAA
ncbi:bifunctional DNA-binding transcriptional regulator/O6-methylguanine-DNA methyltransferase Ada [Sphingopyxis sp.]|uniref:bifunctional DNA-binding transcriptional regulator/O6-methylguanine-DNA methyltransferase Ada n=1 Tax=Sphingopyxis sp. TaxID=1908224 RepID=UPI003F6EDF63